MTLKKLCLVKISPLRFGRVIYKTLIALTARLSDKKREECEDVADIFEYLKWRGDISFAEKRLGEIDSIIFSMIVYVDFDAICKEDSTLMCDAAEGYCLNDEYKSVRLGLIVPSKNINKLFCSAAKTRRYGGVLISDYVAKTSEEENCQFAAATFHMPGKRMAVVFRGTDDSIVGWREDFCLSFMDEIPAQKMAREYLEAMARKYPDERIYVTGHSKGGNLSLYAAVTANDEVKSRLVRVFCHDGPGISYKAINSAEFNAIRKKVAVYLPQSSVVGTMFERGDKYTVVKSSAIGAVQHDPFSWELDGPEFARTELSERGKKNEEQFKSRMRNMTLEEKRDFVNAFFSMVDSTGAKTLSDFSGKGIKKFALMIKNYGGLDKDKRELMVEILLRLFDIGKEKSKE